MKTTKLNLTIIALFVFCNSYCDIVPDNGHYVDKCVTITNLDEYPDVALLGCIIDFSEDNFCYQILESECLYKIYWGNGFIVYAVPASYLIGKNISAMDLPHDPIAIKANVTINPQGFYCPANSPLKRVEQYGRIMGFTDSTVVLFQWKEVMQYYGNLPDSVRYFEYDGDTSAFSQEFPAITNIPEYNEEIKLFPNPGKGHLNLLMSNDFMGWVSVTLFSLNGQVVGSFSDNKTNSSSHFTIPTDHLKPGTYVVRIQYGNKIESRKIVVN